jgi:hypothetical protein
MQPAIPDEKGRSTRYVLGASLGWHLSQLLLSLASNALPSGLWQVWHLVLDLNGSAVDCGHSLS